MIDNAETAEDNAEVEHLRTENRLLREMTDAVTVDAYLAHRYANRPWAAYMTTDAGRLAYVAEELAGMLLADGRTESVCAVCGGVCRHPAHDAFVSRTWTDRREYCRECGGRIDAEWGCSYECPLDMLALEERPPETVLVRHLEVSERLIGEDDVTGGKERGVGA